MKKLLIVLTLLMSVAFTANAQVYRYVSRQFAIASVNRQTGRYSWSDWQPSSIRITIDLNNEVINVYSREIQTYRIIECGDWHRDNNGGTQIQMIMIDQDYDRGKCRLRIEGNGNSQLYIDFADVAWCYSGLQRF